MVASQNGPAAVRFLLIEMVIWIWTPLRLAAAQNVAQQTQLETLAVHNHRRRSTRRRDRKSSYES